MINDTDLDCKIFVNMEGEVSILAQLLADALSGAISGTRQAPTIELPSFEIDLRQNDEADPARASSFPDGFLFFPYALEIYSDPATNQASRIGLVSEILHLLWSRGYAAVAACDFEQELPAGGGYNSCPFPWIMSKPIDGEVARRGM